MRIDINIDPDLLVRVDEQALHNLVSRSALIRLALLEWIERHPLRSTQPAREPQSDAPPSAIFEFLTTYASMTDSDAKELLAEWERQSGR